MQKLFYRSLCSSSILSTTFDYISRKIPYLLNPFFTFLEERNLIPEQLKHREAQDYQTMLATLKDSEGKPHYAASSVSDMVNCARNFCAWLKKKGKIFTNPFSGLSRIHRQEKLPRGIPKEEKMMAFLESLRSFSGETKLWDRRALYRVHVIAELQYSTGMRISEIAGIEKEDLDFDQKTVLIRKTKNGRERKAFLNDYAVNVLKIYLGQMRETVLKKPESSYLFGCRDGRNIESGVNRRLKEKAEQAGIGRFTSHSFRHSVGFHLLRRGCDMRYIQLVLGHEDMNSTSIYTKVEKTDLKSELDRCHPRSGVGR